MREYTEAEKRSREYYKTVDKFEEMFGYRPMLIIGDGCENVEEKTKAGVIQSVRIGIDVMDEYVPPLDTDGIIL